MSVSTFFLGVALMGYSDSDDSSKDAYWSWGSMNAREKVFFTAFIAWNVLNGIMAVCWVYRLFKRIE